MALEAIENPFRPFPHLNAQSNMSVQLNAGCTERTLQANPALPPPAVGQLKCPMMKIPPMPLSCIVLPIGMPVDHECKVSLANGV